VTFLEENKERLDALKAELGLTGVEPYLIDGKPGLMAPSFEVREILRKVWKAEAISSKYRFTGVGSDPKAALADMLENMRDFDEELTRHIAALGEAIGGPDG